jgi:hypothetical protein
MIAPAARNRRRQTPNKARGMAHRSQTLCLARVAAGAWAIVALVPASVWASVASPGPVSAGPVSPAAPGDWWRFWERWSADAAQPIVAGSVAIFVAWFGVLLTLLTLPGTWVTVAAAALVKWWVPGLIGWWALGVLIALAVLGEVLEFFSSAAGAKKTGGSNKAALFAIVGSFAGAVVGSIILLFPIGTIAGAALGAGVGALLAERGAEGKSWTDSTRVGTGAALGRLLATILKGACAAIMALVLTLAVVL